MSRIGPRQTGTVVGGGHRVGNRIGARGRWATGRRECTPVDRARHPCGRRRRHLRCSSTTIYRRPGTTSTATAIHLNYGRWWHRWWRLR